MEQTELRNSLIALHSSSFGWATVCCRGNRELAGDVLQTVYLSILEGTARFGGRSSFRTWLFSVIRNTARNHTRRRWQFRVVPMETGTLAELQDDIDDRASLEDEELTIIRKALRELPERQREIIHLVFYEDLTVADAADVMGVSVGAARQHYARGKESLKAALKPRLTV